MRQAFRKVLVGKRKNIKKQHSKLQRIKKQCIKVHILKRNSSIISKFRCLVLVVNNLQENIDNGHIDWDLRRGDWDGKG